FSSRGRHTRFSRDWSSDVCASDLVPETVTAPGDTTPPGNTGDTARREPATDTGPRSTAPPGNTGDTARREPATSIVVVMSPPPRSEERRVGYGWRAGTPGEDSGRR